MWPELGSNPQRWDDEQFRVLKISGLDHSPTWAAHAFWDPSNGPAQPSSGARSPVLCLKLPLIPYIVWVNSEGSGEIARRDYIDVRQDCADVRRDCMDVRRDCTDLQVRLFSSLDAYVISTLFTWAGSLKQHLSPLIRKPNKMTFAPSEDSDQPRHLPSLISLPCGPNLAKDQSFLHADSKDSDQTGWMPRLIWVFAGRIHHIVGFVVRQRLSIRWLKIYMD